MSDHAKNVVASLLGVVCGIVIVIALNAYGIIWAQTFSLVFILLTAMIATALALVLRIGLDIPKFL